jgi:hypothetical protein
VNKRGLNGDPEFLTGETKSQEGGLPMTQLTRHEQKPFIF